MLQIFRAVFHFFYRHFIVITDFLLCSAHFIRRAYTFSRRDAKVFYDFLVCLRIFFQHLIFLSVRHPFFLPIASSSAYLSSQATDFLWQITQIIRSTPHFAFNSNQFMRLLILLLRIFSRKLTILSVSCNFSHLIVQKSNPKPNC